MKPDLSNLNSTEEKNAVAIHGVPRSGTTWLGEIFNSSPKTIYRYQPLFSYAHKDKLSTDSTKQQIDAFFSDLIDCSDSFTNQVEQRHSGLLPSFPAPDSPTHIVYKEVRYHHILSNLIQTCDTVKVILLVRNPFSVINSWLNAPREFRADLGWKAMEEWRFANRKNADKPEEFHGYEKWKEATRLFKNLATKHPAKAILVTYDSLLDDPYRCTQTLFEFAGLNLDSSTKSFISESVAADNVSQYSIYRKNADDNAWKIQLDQKIIDEISRDLSGSELEEFLPKS